MSGDELVFSPIVYRGLRLEKTRAGADIPASAGTYTDCVETSLLRFVQLALVSLQDETAIDTALVKAKCAGAADPEVEQFLSTVHTQVEHGTWYDLEDGFRIRHLWAALLNEHPDSFIYNRPHLGHSRFPDDPDFALTKCTCPDSYGGYSVFPPRVDGRYEVQANIPNHLSFFHRYFGGVAAAWQARGLPWPIDPIHQTADEFQPYFDELGAFFSRDGRTIALRVTHSLDQQGGNGITWRLTRLAVSVNGQHIWNWRVSQVLQNGTRVSGHSQIDLAADDDEEEDDK